MKNKIIIGIDQTTDINQLLNDGIRQFYFGYISAEYLNTYSTQTSLNRRYRLKEQFTDIEAISVIIEEIHKKNAIIYLALNSFTSNETMRGFSLELYELFHKRVDGIIVANISMASVLKKRGYNKIVISNLFGLYSCDAVSFIIKQFNPIKIILPRDISLDDIQTIVTKFKKTDFECFLYGDNCRFSEGFCFTEHGYDSTGFGSLCSYASQEKVLLKVATPSYKHIVNNSTMSDDEKRELLLKEKIDIESLLEKIELHVYEFDSKQIAQTLETLSLFDIALFTKEKRTYIRAINTLKALEFPKAQEILKTLQESPYKEENSYKIFHNLNTNAIHKTLKFFEQFENIASYKIPSRGRAFYKYLQIQNDEPYNYKESQYRL